MHLTRSEQRKHFQADLERFCLDERIMAEGGVFRNAHVIHHYAAAEQRKLDVTEGDVAAKRLSRLSLDHGTEAAGIDKSRNGQERNNHQEEKDGNGYQQLLHGLILAPWRQTPLMALTRQAPLLAGRGGGARCGLALGVAHQRESRVIIGLMVTETRDIEAGPEARRLFFVHLHRIQDA